MIHITKPQNGPAKLDEGAAFVSAYEAARIADPEEGASMKRAFKFEQSIYGDRSVKRALRAAQKNKCCYCEGNFAAQSYGDVEHFRPKACVQQARGRPLLYPGYFWLAYTWSNLYYSCEICNRSGKGSLFPLDDPTRRAQSGTDPLAQEFPQILDPGGEMDPRDHIKFSGPTPYGVSELGRSTICCLWLKRGDLIFARLQHLKLLEARRDTLDVLAKLAPAGLDPEFEAKRERAIEDLRRAVEPDAIYSAMAQDYLAA